MHVSAGDQFLLGTVGKGSECHLLVWKVNPATGEVTEIQCIDNWVFQS